jgi:signal transduction histidine kinase
VSTASRRILTYWLLLLVPTLVVGFGSIQLLRREQARLAGQEANAGEARRAAVAARAGLIVENIELLVDDLQTGLLETLTAMPASGLDAELTLWEKSNPLVRVAFRCTADGRIVRPSASATDEEARGFRRRFAGMLEHNPPWRQAPVSPPPVAAPESQKEASTDEQQARQQAYSNVAQVQSARRDAKAIAKLKDYSPRPSSAESSVAGDKLQRAENSATAGRQGWTPWSADGRLHLLGWVEMDGPAEVRGVEVEVAALIARLGGALPAETGPGEGYALRDDKGRTMHQTGWIPRSDQLPATRLPLAGSALSGWEVVAFLDAPVRSASAGSGFFLVSSLLVGILVVAILAGGSLLVWQARQSAAEAVQKTSFVANVSHEFKTPLTTIRLYAELLEQGRVPDEAKRGDYLRTIGRETQRLARLVGNALDFSRLEQGRKKFERAPLDLRTELTRLLDTQEPILLAAGLKLHRGLPGELAPVSTDRDALEQIILNLLDNAAKYGAAGGEVTVELAPRPAGGAVVRVSDRGPGVPVEHRERIFEKFHRVDDALTAEKAGAGLGLSIARQLARGLGGDLRFVPRVGGGAVFEVTLP